MRQNQAQSIVGELEGISLGDKRLDRRLLAIAIAMEAAPGDSLVEQAGDVASVEATYRFFSNERVRAESIFDAHERRRCALCALVTPTEEPHLPAEHTIRSSPSAPRSTADCASSARIIA